MSIFKYLLYYYIIIIVIIISFRIRLVLIHTAYVISIVVNNFQMLSTIIVANLARIRHKRILIQQLYFPLVVYYFSAIILQ